MVAASAIKGSWSVAADQSVNSVQSAAYPAIVLGASGRPVTADRAGAHKSIRVTALPTRGACSRAYTSSIFGSWWPGCRMIECASAPARNASVTNPDRNE